MIEAIPTTYAGITFRSRLEARYAFIFDSLGILWQYEPQPPFNLGAAGWYLPDFYLPDLAMYVEIKPGRSLVTPEARAKIKAFPMPLKVLYSLTGRDTAKFLATAIRGRRAAELVAVIDRASKKRF